ncbi:hypothetical protein [Companilactobacillus insicii]|uniref:hypothetical protein n=1 Tax=Companilactobacillus insicii TaxID=1732567 RepID=UPI0013DDA6A7|nr:hypothetical protein [Companilactobacillus insicii]
MKNKTIKRLYLAIGILVVILLINLFFNGPLEVTTGLSVIVGFLIATICYGRKIINNQK